METERIRCFLAGIYQSYTCCGNWTSDGKYFVFQAGGSGSHNVWALCEKADVSARVVLAKPILRVRADLH
jgi:hypothetical protein